MLKKKKSLNARHNFKCLTTTAHLILIIVPEEHFIVIPTLQMNMQGNWTLMKVEEIVQFSEWQG